MRLLLAAVFAALVGLAIAAPATAGATPASCPNQNTVILQGQPLPTQGNVVCDDDQTGRGLLRNAPLVGNLPGVGGIL